MKNLREQKYIALIAIIVLCIGIILLTKFGETDRFKGLIKVEKIKTSSTVLNADILNATTSQVQSKGYAEVDYKIDYTLSQTDGINTRNVIINGRLNDSYSTFKKITGENITSTLSNNNKSIEVRIRNVPLGEEVSTTLKILIEGAPNNHVVNPIVTIQEETGEAQLVNTQNINVSTKSIIGEVRDQNNVLVKNIELSLYKGTTEIKRTYTNENGKYVFTDIEDGTYEIKVEEDVYEIDSANTTKENTVLNLKVKAVEPYQLKTKKYINQVKLKVNGEEKTYTYGELEKVVQAVKNMKTLSGEIKYVIKITNTGEKAGIITIAKDELQDGLSFNKDKNPGWEQDEDNLYFRPIEDVKLNAGETRSIDLILDIKDTTEAKVYINKITSKGEEYENIVYMLNGTKYAEDQVLEGELIDELEITDENFSGWYTDRNYTNRYNFKIPVTKDLILYGKTIAQVNQYNVRFHNFANEVIKTVTVNENELVDSSEAPIITEDAYIFTGWHELSIVTPFDFTTPITRDVDLYPSHQIKQNQVIFDDENRIRTVDVDYGDTVKPLESLGKDYHNFRHWSLQKNGTPFDFNTQIIEPTRLYAVYTPINHTVTFIDDPNEDPYRVVTVAHGAKVSAPTPDPSKAHNIFLGWKEKNASNNFAFDTTEITEDKTLYSQYEEVLPPDISHTPTEWTRGPVTVTIEKENHSDYSFTYKLQNGTYASYNGEFPVDDNTTVYAFSTKDGVSSIEASHVIDNIDKINPTISTFDTSNITQTSADVRISAKDNESGLHYIRIYKDDVLTDTFTYISDLNDTKTENYTLTNLQPNTEYRIKIEAEDIVTNKTVSQEKTIKTLEQQQDIIVARIIGRRGSLYQSEDLYENFSTLRAAFTSCSTEQCTVQMLASVNETNTVYDNQDITLDLNGYTITGVSDNTFAVEELASYTIVDDAVTPGKILNNNNTAILNEGILTIGRIEDPLEVSTTVPYIEGNTIGLDQQGTFNFYDGVIKGTTAITTGGVSATPEGYGAIVNNEDRDGEEIEEAHLTTFGIYEARIGNAYFMHIEDAVTSANSTDPDNPTTIVVLKNISLTNTLEIDNTKNIVIDLNGYRIDNTAAVNTLNNSGNLEITDLSPLKTGKFTNTNTSTIINNDGANLKITTGGIDCTKSGKSIIENSGTLSVENDDAIVITQSSPVILNTSTGVITSGGKYEMSLTGSGSGGYVIYNQSTKNQNISNLTVELISGSAAFYNNSTSTTTLTNPNISGSIGDVIYNLSGNIIVNGGVLGGLNEEDNSNSQSIGINKDNLEINNATINAMVNVFRESNSVTLNRCTVNNYSKYTSGTTITNYSNLTINDSTLNNIERDNTINIHNEGILKINDSEINTKNKAIQNVETTSTVKEKNGVIYLNNTDINKIGTINTNLIENKGEIIINGGDINNEGNTSTVIYNQNKLIVENDVKVSENFTNGINNDGGIVYIGNKFDKKINSDEDDVYEFSYTGTPQTFTAPQAGKYKVELWGASGGKARSSSSTPSSNPGRGAYTSGIIELNQNDTFYVYVGGEGASVPTTITNATSTYTSNDVLGGYNGGGNGYYIKGTTYTTMSASGGGATDIRTTNGDCDNAASLASRIMVASGGGGSSYILNGSSTTVSYTDGMHGAGLRIEDPISSGGAGYWTPVVNQTQGNEFGKGQNGLYNNKTSVPSTGAGGGYYGGLGYVDTQEAGASIRGGRSSGGSSYISGYPGSVAITSASDTTAKSGCADGTFDITCSYHYSGYKFTDAEMIPGKDIMPSTTGEMVYGNLGNGFARISLVTDEIIDSPQDVSTTSPEIGSSEKAIITDATGIVSFYDGKLISKTNSHVENTISSIPTSYEIKVEEDGKETVTLNELTDYVAQIGNKKFTSLLTAVNSVKTGDKTVITILKDFDCYENIDIDGYKDIEINYNGHYINNQNQDYFYYNKGKLKLYDDTNGEKPLGESNAQYFIKNEGTAILNNIKVKSINTSGVLITNTGANSVFTMNSGELTAAQGWSINNDGTFTMNGGKIEVIARGSNLIYSTNTGTMNISGGTYYENGLFNYNTFNASNNAKLGNYANGNTDISLNAGFYNKSTEQYPVVTMNINGALIGKNLKISNNSAGTDLEQNTKLIFKNVEDAPAVDPENPVIYNASILSSGITEISDLDLNDFYISTSGPMSFKDSTFRKLGVNDSCRLEDEYDLENDDPDDHKYPANYLDNITADDNSTVSVIGQHDFIIKNSSISNASGVINSGGKTITLGYSNSPYELEEQYVPILTIINSDIVGQNYGVWGANSRNNGRLILGEKGAPVSQTKPSITGGVKGIDLSTSHMLMKFYDGRVTGTTAIDSDLAEIEPDYTVVTSTSGGLESKYLDQPKIIKNMSRQDLKEYSSIQEAINEAESGQLLKMILDYSNTANDSTISIGSTKNIVFDLNGHSIVASNELFMNNSGTLEIKDDGSNGSITSENGKFIQNSGTLTIKSGSYSAPLLIDNSGTTTLDNGTYSNGGFKNTNSFTINKGSYSLKSFGEEMAANSSSMFASIYNTKDFTINAGTFSISNPILTIDNSTLDINGGSYSVNGVFIYNLGDTSIENVSSITRTNSNQLSSRIVNENELEIKNTTSNILISNKGNATLDKYTNTNENNTNSGTMTIKNQSDMINLNNTGTLTITGSTIKSSNINTTKAITNNAGGTVTIGTKNSSYDDDDCNIQGIDNKGTLKFYDGFFKSYDDDLGYVSDIETGKTIKIEHVVEDNKTYIKSTLSNDNVYENNTTHTGYKKLEDAINNATTGQTIKVIRDIVVEPKETTTISIPSGKTVTLDLNGKTLYTSAKIENAGTFNLTGSGASKLVSYRDIFVENTGTVNLQGGDLTNPIIHTESTATSAILNISGGTILYDKDDEINLYGETNITDGDITLKETVKNNGDFTMSGGSLDLYKVFTNSSSVTFKDDAEVSISKLNNTTAGNFTNEVAKTFTIKNIDLTLNAGVFLTNSGTFKMENGVVKSIPTDTATRFLNNSHYQNANVEITGGSLDGRCYVIAGTANEFKISNFTVTNGYEFFTEGTSPNVVTLTNNTVTTVSKGAKITSGANVTGGTYTVTGGAGFEISGGTTTFNGTTVKGKTYGISSSSRVNIIDSNIMATTGTGFQSSVSTALVESTIKNSTIKSESGIALVNTNKGQLIIGEEGGTPNDTMPRIEGKTYAISGNNIAYYDGILVYQTGGIISTGTLAIVEPGYKVASVSITEDDVSKTKAYLEALGTDDTEAVVNGLNFGKLQQAINYSLNHNLPDVVLAKNVSLEANLTATNTVNLYLNGYTITQNNYSISSYINRIEGAPSGLGAAINDVLYDTVQLTKNPINIIIYQMEDGTTLSSEKTYKLYKENKVLKMKKDEGVSNYTVGNDIEDMSTTRGRLYINNLAAGEYRLVGSDNKEISFTINDDLTVTGKVKINNNLSNKVISEAVAEYIITLQTGINKSNILLIGLLVSIIGLLLIAIKQQKRFE